MLYIIIWHNYMLLKGILFFKFFIFLGLGDKTYKKYTENQTT